MPKDAITKYRQLRNRLLDRGYTLRSWALHHDYKPTTVYAAARGSRNGIKTRQIRRELESSIDG